MIPAQAGPKLRSIPPGGERIEPRHSHSAHDATMPMTVPYLRHALAAALLPLLAACAQQPATMAVYPPAPVADTTKPTDSGEAARAAARAAADAEKSRVFKGTGIVVRGQDSGGALPPSPPLPPPAAGPVVLNFEGADLREVDPQRAGRHPEPALHDRSQRRRTGDDPHDGRHPARRAAGDARDAVANERRDDDLRRQPVEGRSANGRRARQRDAAARQFDARAAAGLFRADRAAEVTWACATCCAILEPFAKDAQTIRVDDVRNLLILSGHRARASPPARDDRHVRHRLDVGDVGRRLHAAERRRQVGVAGARQARSATATRARSRASCASSRSSG